MAAPGRRHVHPGPDRGRASASSTAAMCASPAPAGPTQAYMPWARSPRFRSGARSSPMRWCGRSMPGFPPTSGCCRRTRSPQISTRATARHEDLPLSDLEHRLSSAHSSVTTPGTCLSRWTWTRWTAAARSLEGRHDFAAFAAAGGTTRTTERTVLRSRVTRMTNISTRSTTEDTGDTEEKTGLHALRVLRVLRGGDFRGGD